MHHILTTYPPTTGDADELNKRMDVVVDLCKANIHLLVLRHHYTGNTLHCMVRATPNHVDAHPNLVWEDMSVMSQPNRGRVIGVCVCVWCGRTRKRAV